jgi:TetR/AcrR family transcriptional repressor of nem operon
MRVSREQAAANRQKILDVAGTLFRERGFDGTGVDDIMKRAGLTHGGFYGYFRSKDDLAAETCTRVCMANSQILEQFLSSTSW